MISASRSFLPRTAIIAPRIAAASGSNRFFSFASDLAKKERVEEERYIRSKEHDDYLKRKAKEELEKPTFQMTPEEIGAQIAHNEAVDEAFEILSRAGCKVADGTVEALADWKIGRK